MKSDIPEKVADTLREIGMTPKQAGWNCHGTYVLLHKALEKVAVHRKIVFKEPTILECNSEKKSSAYLSPELWETNQSGLLERHLHPTTRIAIHMLWLKREPKTE